METFLSFTIPSTLSTSISGLYNSILFGLLKGAHKTLKYTTFKETKNFENIIKNKLFFRLFIRQFI
jgi:hypothetical protein